MALAVVREEPLAALAEYGRIPIAFEVRSVLECTPRERGLAGFDLVERPVAMPWTKDYDAIAGDAPARWARRFDVSRWGLLSAREPSAPEGAPWLGGATIAFDTPGVHMLEERRDLAVLWDLRVRPDVRARGVGATLFRAAEAWAAARGCRWLKVETQNVNVPACRFYAAQGCTLGAIHRFAYAELPDEVQLLWYRDLRG